jgi:hypothetical protein
MAQGQHFEVKRESGSHQPSERRQQRCQNGYHREESLSVTAGKFNGANEYRLFQQAQRTFQKGHLPLKRLWR